jgi:hypothetical protein
MGRRSASEWAAEVRAGSGFGGRTRRLTVAAIAAALIAAMGASLGVAGLASASTPPLCIGTQLSARIVDWQGAAGSRIADVVLVNTSFSSCAIRNYPRVRLVSAHGTVLINGSAASTTAVTHVLGRLGFLKTEVSASNYCGSAYAKPVTLVFVLPGTMARVVAIPVSPADTAGVPPCLGAPGSAGHIAMHAWHT